MLASPYWLAVAGYSLLFICLQSLHVMAIPTLSAVGSKFFTSDGDQFFIKGSYAIKVAVIVSIYANE